MLLCITLVPPPATLKLIPMNPRRGSAAALLGAVYRVTCLGPRNEYLTSTAAAPEPLWYTNIIAQYIYFVFILFVFIFLL